MDYQIEALGYPLPEDIEKLKWHGDFQGAMELIQRRLEEDIPETLKKQAPHRADADGADAPGLCDLTAGGGEDPV